MSDALFPGGIRALNVGVAEFARAPRANGATLIELDWRPPAAGDRALGLLVARLADDPDDAIGARVASANRQATRASWPRDPSWWQFSRPRISLLGLGRGPFFTPGRPSPGPGCAGRCGGP